MIFISKYHGSHFNELEKILSLNSPKYFAPSEINDFKKYLVNGVEDYFVLLEKDQIIGAGGINYEKTHAVLSWDFIHPDYHGKGLGTKLVKHRLVWIKEKTDFTKVIVRTSQHTHEFYAKMGFELVNTEKDYWAIGFDLYEMKMNL